MIKQFIRQGITKFYSTGLFHFGKNCHISYPAYFHGKNKIKLGDNIVIGRHSRIETYSPENNESNNPKIIIEDNVNINWYSHLGAINKIHIKQNVLIGSYVLITDHSHGTTSQLHQNPLSRGLVSPGPVIIEEDCWIGEKVSILPNVTIGHNSIIGANYVVTHDIPPYSVAVGCPAKVIKQLYE